MPRKEKAKRNETTTYLQVWHSDLLYTSLLLQLYFHGDIKINLGLIITTKLLLPFLLKQKKDNIYLASVR